MGHWLGGILLLGILGGGVVAAAMLLWENLDVRQLAPTLVAAPTSLPEPVDPGPPAIRASAFSAVLLNSPRNAAFFPDQSYYPTTVARWRGMIGALGGELREVGSFEDLEGMESASVLIVPEAPCLSQRELEAVRAHVDAGGSLVFEGALGVRDESCEWRGWGPVRALTGARDLRELEVTGEGLFLTVPAGTPLSAGLDPGSRIELLPEPSLALFSPGPRVFWSDWALNPLAAGGGDADAAAMAGIMDGGGRLAWFGFRVTRAATPRDSVRLERLVGNGILWAAGIPSAAPAPWPGGAQAALVVAQDVEAEHESAMALAEILAEQDLPGTFFAVSGLVSGDQPLAEALGSVGEIGSHTSDHLPLVGLSYRDQAVRLRRSQSELEDWTGSEVAGLRPPEESFDTNTIRAWHEAGGRYLMAVNQARSASPEVHFWRDRKMVVIPRLMKDDYNVFVQEGAIRTERLTEAFLEGLRKLRTLGGVATVDMHTQIVGDGRRLDAVRAVGAEVRSDGDWWAATAGDVARWWDGRSEVAITFVSPGSPGRDPADGAAGGSAADSLTEIGSGDGPPGPVPAMEFLVESPRDLAGTELWIEVMLPEGVGDLKPFVDGVPVPFRSTDWGIRVPVGALEAGASLVLSLRSTPAQ
jgi:peptidoglycan/xylan/chitin deacetylase (PgdA/CDA1 family)